MYQGKFSVLSSWEICLRRELGWEEVNLARYGSIKLKNKTYNLSTL